jgi:hypothetical protein
MAKINLEFTDQASQEIQALADAKGTSKSEIIRKALNLYSYVEKASKNGEKLILENPQTHDKKEVVWL